MVNSQYWLQLIKDVIQKLSLAFSRVSDDDDIRSPETSNFLELSILFTFILGSVLRRFAGNASKFPRFWSQRPGVLHEISMQVINVSRLKRQKPSRYFDPSQ